VQVWAWKEVYGSRITDQERHLGISADWSRERFTMDPMLSGAVQEAFVRLHERGLIYRDTRLVNWCCRLRTAISDVEVDYIDIEKRTLMPVPGHDPAKRYEFGVLTSFAYKIAGSETGEEIVVATTRPETMLGDTAVAVHPTDTRYAHLHGKLVVHPFFPDRRIPIITDGELVDPTFGTGAVKITPAHDPNDYKCGKRHGLEFITVFTEDGFVNERGGEFAGMMRFDARRAVQDALDKRGLLRGKADNKMRLGLCSRSGDVIEPLIKPQWYVKCEGMAKAAADAARSGELKILPGEGVGRGGGDGKAGAILATSSPAQRSTSPRGTGGWTTSRTGASAGSCGGATASQPTLCWSRADREVRPGATAGGWGAAVCMPPPLCGAGESSAPDNWVVARTREEAIAVAAARFGVSEADIELEQDEDVLDTWFSSGLFPFATMGWPDESHPDFRAFYPNTILETGHDILFFWVARMVMLGITLTGKLPFKTVRGCQCGCCCGRWKEFVLSAMSRAFPPSTPLPLPPPPPWVCAGVPARHGARQARRQDVQVEGQRDRPHGGHLRVRAGHPARQGAGGQPAGEGGGGGAETAEG